MFNTKVLLIVFWPKINNISVNMLLNVTAFYVLDKINCIYIMSPLCFAFTFKMCKNNET